MIAQSTIIIQSNTQVQDNVKNCGQYFWLLLKFAQGGAQHCAQLFRFQIIINIIIVIVFIIITNIVVVASKIGLEL